MNKFLELRSKYQDFIYEKYEIKETEKEYEISFYFNIPSLTSFQPKLVIEKENITNHHIDNRFLKFLVFNIGLVELISYIKCTCSPNIIIKCGYLDDYQISWFQKLYYNGLGEFLYRNNIDIEEKDLFNITITNQEKQTFDLNYQGHGNLIPVGGGKDSNVTLELLKDEDNTCFIINPKGANLECAKISGFKITKVQRILDKKIIELNHEGFLNGHTPFSAIVAFLSYLVAYLENKKYIILSNEDSANQATVFGTNINHQYSKTYEFENDFNHYAEKYFKTGIKYFSLLRPLTEFQIGMLFSKMKKYHQAFKSCNIGSKGETWNWCNHCSKCLFVFIILSPMLYKEELISIFHKDLYEDDSLLETFQELLGYKETKPWECVGTYEEVRYAVSLLIQKLNHQKLPYLLKYYKDHYPLYLDDKFEAKYNHQNNLDEHFEKLVKEAIKNVS